MQSDHLAHEIEMAAMNRRVISLLLPLFLGGPVLAISEISGGQEGAAMKGCDFNFGCLKLLDWLDRLCIVHVDHHVEAGSCFFNLVCQLFAAFFLGNDPGAFLYRDDGGIPWCGSLAVHAGGNR